MSPTHHRVAIIGSGPAGYTAGLYTARALLQPLVLTGLKNGGQLMNTTVIENFPGFPEGVQGPKLMMDMRAQAEKFGATLVDQYATAIDVSERPFKIWTNTPAEFSAELMERGSEEDIAKLRADVQAAAEPAYTADAIILAVGAKAKMLGIPGEDTFLGRGVSTCAVCDAAFFREKNVIVVGGGDTAMEDTLALTRFADTVTVLVRGPKLRASKVMQERVLNHPKVKVEFNTSPLELKGEAILTHVVTKNNETGETSERPIHGFFLAIGHAPMTHLVKGVIRLDDHGFIVTRQSPTKIGVEAAQAALDAQGNVAFPTMTSVAGVFAAGDVVDPRYWQAITAAGQGCMTAIDAERWLEER